MKTPQIVFALFLLIILVSTGSHAQSVYYVSHSTSLKEDGSQAYPYPVSYTHLTLPTKLEV